MNKNQLSLILEKRRLFIKPFQKENLGGSAK